MQGSNPIETFVRDALRNPSRCIPEQNFVLVEGNLAHYIAGFVTNMGYDAPLTHTNHYCVWIKVLEKDSKRLVGTFVTNGNDQASFEPCPAIA
jgi:hypothetical protein